MSNPNVASLANAGIPYFPHYRAHWVIRRTVNKWSVFDLTIYIRRIKRDNRFRDKIVSQ